MNNNDESLDEFISALGVSNIPTNKALTVKDVPETIDEDEELINVLAELDELTMLNNAVLEEAKGLVERTGEASYLEAYSSISKAQADAIKAKMKLLSDKQKTRINKNLKEREVVVKEKLADHMISDGMGLPSGATLNQTNNLVFSGSREEMFKLVKQQMEKVNVDAEAHAMEMEVVKEEPKKDK